MKDQDRLPNLVADADDDEDVEILEVIGVGPGPEEDPEHARPGERDDEDSAEEYVLDFDDPGTPAADASASSLQAPDPGDPEHQTLMRLRADYDNLRKRIDRERKEFEVYANFALVGRLLPVVDNLDRALAVEAATHVEGGLREGVVMIYRQLLDELRREGLHSIDAVGRRFDPNLHDAVATEASEQVPAQTVMEVFQKGYMFQDRVLRPSMVKVSTGPADASEDGK